MAATTGTLDQQINNYLSLLNTRQKKALLTVAKTFATEQNDYSDEFKSEMDSRFEAYEKDGQVVSEAEVNRRIDKIIKGKGKK